MSVRRDPQRRTWSVVVDVPAVGGRRQQIRRRGFTTKRAAEEAEALIVADRARGDFRRPAKGTVGEYLHGWLEGRRADLRPTTFTSYRTIVRVRIVPWLGDVRLADLDASAVESWYVRLLAGGGEHGRSLSAKTVANAGGVLSIAMGDAVRLGVLRSNPTAAARLPRRERVEMAAWSADEAAAFLVAAAEHRLAPVWRLVLATGLRRGELCGLRWRDVDLGAGTVEIVQTRVVADRVEIGPPKTKAGARVISLDGGTVEALRAWRARQAGERLAVGAGWVDVGLVLVDEIGRPPHPENVTRWWREAIEATGVRSIRLHDARHSAATMALRAGVPVKVVTQRLGHADVAVTMRVYQHVTAQDDRAAADVLGRALG